MQTRYRTAAALLALSLALGAQGLAAEEQTLLGDLGNIEHGGYGGPAVRFTQIAGDSAVLSGGEGAWIINHRYVLGGGGYGLANPGKVLEADATGDLVEGELEMGYGGGLLGVIIRSDALVHASVDVLIGAGGMTMQEVSSDDAFFIAEPAAHLVLNLTDFCRLAAGVSYRFVKGADYGGLTNGDLDGPSWGLLLKFGSF